jgi:hypothetical protein
MRGRLINHRDKETTQKSGGGKEAGANCGLRKTLDHGEEKSRKKKTREDF